MKGRRFTPWNPMLTVPVFMEADTGWPTCAAGTKPPQPTFPRGRHPATKKYRRLSGRATPDGWRRPMTRRNHSHTIRSCPPRGVSLLPTATLKDDDAERVTEAL